MDTLQQFYINGSWVSPAPGATTHAVINPANEEQIATLPLAQAADIDVQSTPPTRPSPPGPP